MNEQPTSTWTVLDEAHRALRAAIAGIQNPDWLRPTPCTEWNVAQVLQHAAGDQLGYAAAVTGTGWPTFDPFAPTGHLPSDATSDATSDASAEAASEPGADSADFAALALFAEETMRASAATYSAIPQDAPEVATPLPQGKLPAWLAAGACALDAAVHAWDIARATNQPSPLDNSLSRDLLKVAQELTEPLRAWGAYAAIVPATPSDDDTATLLRYLGRDPHWTAPTA
ncbi:maleylpyruvate isomerase family mycothiol-dependent enzyme [Dactylosporangium sp. CS-033363]|uniref:maleylpyruvate isomerase family mycothiol-dependent enzyme n=1 Tax=Dactylosporangium sp. CS-033363 TaxID=3239935 RepID=UPI003D92134C